MLVLYGSQTGNSEEIANSVAIMIKEWGYPVDHCTSFQAFLKADPKLASLAQPGQVLIVVVSSTGCGEPPDDTSRFKSKIGRMLKGKIPALDLKQLQYAVLGLGDTNYSEYGAIPKFFDAAFEQMGAERFTEFALADDGVGLELVVEPWKEELQDYLEIAMEQAAEMKTGLEEKTSLPDANTTQTAAEVPPETRAANATSREGQNNDSKDSTGGHMGNSQARSLAAFLLKQFPTPVPERSTLGNVAKLRKVRFSLEYSEEDSTSSDLANYHVRRFGAVDSKSITDNMGYVHDAPVMAELTSARYLTEDGVADRTVVHLDLELPSSLTGASEGGDSLPVFTPGDSIGIHCPNRPTVVQAILHRLNEPRNRVIRKLVPGEKVDSANFGHLHTPATTEQLLTHAVDLQALPKKSFIRMLAEYTADASEKAALLYLCSASGNLLYRKYFGDKVTPLDLLYMFPSTQPPLAHVLDLLQPNQPRFYSAASAPTTHSPCGMGVAFSLVTWQNAEGKDVSGQCTGWLYDLCLKGMLLSKPHVAVDPAWEGADLLGCSVHEDSGRLTMPVFIKRSSIFHVPTTKGPVLMIGTGTGVSPYRGFCQHVQQQAEKHAPMHLVFGCRARDVDYLYGQEWEAWLNKTKILDSLDVAFSRETDTKRYVQHILEEKGEFYAQILLAPDAHVFICGDGKNMPKQVVAALTQTLEANKSMLPQDATPASVIAQLTKERRLVIEVWS